MGHMNSIHGPCGLFTLVHEFPRSENHWNRFSGKTIVFDVPLTPTNRDAFLSVDPPYNRGDWKEIRCFLKRLNLENERHVSPSHAKAEN